MQKPFSVCEQEQMEVFPILVPLIVNHVMMLKNRKKIHFLRFKTAYQSYLTMTHHVKEAQSTLHLF